VRSVFIQNLKKNYGDQRVLDGINLVIEEGEFYALMGPNGSGKSTLSSIMASVTRFDSGILEIYGKK
jgi:ABC-2 type transport system ATP-binding protein